MSLGARVFLLLVPLVTTLDSAAVHAAESRDFAGLVDIGDGRKMYLECRGIGSPTGGQIFFWHYVLSRDVLNL
jgi:hypothetical protein